jgi:hypothetical protein
VDPTRTGWARILGAKRILDQIPARIVGVVFNKVPLSGGGYHNYYAYHRYYGDYGHYYRRGGKPSSAQTFESRALVATRPESPPE